MFISNYALNHLYDIDLISQSLRSSPDISEEENCSDDPSPEGCEEDVGVASAHQHAHDVTPLHAGKLESFGVTESNCVSHCFA